MAGSLLQAFVLGNAAILTNVCLLPLYPGLVAYLLSLLPHTPRRGDRGGTMQPSGAAPGTAPGRVALPSAAPPNAALPSSDPLRAALLGAAVLAGVLAVMVAVGAVFALVKTSVTTALPVLLPLVYLAVTVLGVLLLLGRNPLRRLPMYGGALPRRPYLAAFSYGLLLGPMTLPCTGPIVASAFVLGLGSPGFVAEGLAFFAVFGLGFGWPLVLIPVLSAGASRRFSGWLVRNHSAVTRASGVVLVGIGLFGLVVEVVPNVV